MTRLRLFAIPCDAGDRGPIVAVSGQPLVPVLDDGGTVVTDSSGIIEYLERQHPQHPLFPSDRAERVRMRIFISWFDRVWNVYADDEFVYWGFGGEALRRLAELAGFTGFELHAAPIIDGHPRTIASLTHTTDE